MTVCSQRKSTPHPAVPPGALKRGKTCFGGNFIFLDNKIIHRVIWRLWNKSYRFIKVDVFWRATVQMSFSEEYERVNTTDRERAPSWRLWGAVEISRGHSQSCTQESVEDGGSHFKDRTDHGSSEGYLTWIMVPPTFRSFCATITRMPMK